MLLVTLAHCKSTEGYESDEALAGPRFTGSWLYDTGTLCTVGEVTMHCCPSGMAMIGAHVVDNVFKCAQLTDPHGEQFLDIETFQNGMHRCPSGSVMVGLHVTNNQFACRRRGGASPRPCEGFGTMDSYPMHVCPHGHAMSGIRLNDNVLACAP